MFFLSDIYGPKDLSRHEEGVRRILPIMKQVLPVPGLETVADAIELNARRSPSTPTWSRPSKRRSSRYRQEDYVQAYRVVGRRPDRERQIEIIGHLGKSLDKLTRKPFIGDCALDDEKARHFGGLSDCRISRKGLQAFRTMKGGEEFLEKITSREQALLNEWFGNGAALGVSG